MTTRQCEMGSDWREYSLDEVYSFASGLSKSRDEFGFGYPFVSFKDVFENFFLPKTLGSLANTTEKERLACSVKRGDVFLTRTSETQEELGMSSVALIDYPDATFNGFTKRLRPLGAVEVSPEYAGFYFRSPRFRAAVTSMSSITTRASLNNDMLAALKIVLPPPIEQEAIGMVLTNLDNKIDLLHRQNKTLEVMAETLFRQWFVDEANPRWAIGPLKSFADIGIGRTPPRKEHEWFSESQEDIKWISIKDLADSGAYVFHTAEYLTQAAVDRFSIPVIPENTVLLSFKMTVGRVAITTEAMLSNEAIAHFKFKPQTPFSVEYLYLFLKRYRYDALGSTSSIVTAINSAMIKDIEIVVPDAQVMAKFDGVTKEIFRKIRCNQVQVRALEQLRDTLLPKLMSGEVRVEV